MEHCSLGHVPLGGQQPVGTAPLEGTDPPSAPSHAQLAQGSYFLLGVSAKHFREDVSTTVSQNVTTGSATSKNKKLYKVSNTFLFVKRLFEISQYL